LENTNQEEQNLYQIERMRNAIEYECPNLCVSVKNVS